MCSVSMHFSSGPTAAAAIADYLQMITLENLQQQFRRPKHCFRWISSRFSKMLYSCCRQGCSCEGGGGLLFVPGTAAAPPLLLPLLCARYLDDGHTRCTKGLNSFGVQIVGNQDQYWGNQKMWSIRVTENRCYLTSCIRCLSSISLLKVWQTAVAATLRSINIVLFASTHTNTNDKYYFPKSIDYQLKIVFSTNTDRENNVRQEKVKCCLNQFSTFILRVHIQETS